MVAAPVKHGLVGEAHAALLRLAMSHLIAAPARKLATELHDAWQRSPFVLGICGDVASRTTLINELCATELIDPSSQLARPVIHVRRGQVSRCRGLRDDGSVLEIALPARRPDTPLRGRAESQRQEVSQRAITVQDAEAKIPALVRRRPRAWMFWLWPIRWLLARTQRATVAAWNVAAAELRESEQLLETFDRKVADHDAHERSVRERHAARLREATLACRELVVEIDHGPLPGGIEVLEIAVGSRVPPEVDAVLMAESDGVYARTADTAVRIGDAAEMIAALPTLLGDARAARLVRRVRHELGSILTGLETERLRVEQGFVERIAAIEARRLADPAAFADSQLARVRPQIASSVNTVIEHAAVHLGAELKQLGNEWIASIANTTSNDELKQSVSQIDEQAPASVQRIAEEVRLLVAGGAGGIVHDLVRGLVTLLADQGLSEADVYAPRSGALPLLDMLPSLVGSASNLSGGESWLAGLFRSFETRRTDIHGKAVARLAHLEEIASAELLDIEPRLHAMISDALSTELGEALARHDAALVTLLTNERYAIAGARGALLPLERTLGDGERACDQILDGLARLEAEAPAAAIAARAAG